MTTKGKGRPLPARVVELLQYYIECAREDEGRPVAALLSDSGKRFIPWPAAQGPWSSDATKIATTLKDSQRAFRNQLTNSGGDTLLFGYPIYIQAGRKATPLLTWPIDYELDGETLTLHAIPEWPQLNPHFLQQKASSREEQREILDALGLLDTGDAPPADLVSSLITRMDDMRFLEDSIEPLEPLRMTNNQSSPLNLKQTHGIVNRGALFVMERPRFTDGLIRDLKEMADSGAPGWENTALATILGERDGTLADETVAVEVGDLNEEQREAIRKSRSSLLTAVTGPPGTGKSQIIVSMIADAYMRGERVLFASKNNKAVDVVEKRVTALAENPILIRTGSRFRPELTQRLAAMLALQPSEEDRRRYDEVRGRYRQLRDHQDDLEDQLRAIRRDHEAMDSRGKAYNTLRQQYSSDKWAKLEGNGDPPDTSRLNEALRIVERREDRSAGVLKRLLNGLSTSSDRNRIERIAVEALTCCPVLDPLPSDRSSFQNWRVWISHALGVTDALEVIEGLRTGFEQVHARKQREDIAREARRARFASSALSSEMVSLHARLAPDRLAPKDREDIGNFRAYLERLQSDQLGGQQYIRLRKEMAKVFRRVSTHIPAWCVTNLSARGSLPLADNMFDLLIIDEASQCDIASALPLLYRSGRAVIIGDTRQLQHVTHIERRRDQELQAARAPSLVEPIFAYSQNSLFDLTISRGAIGHVIQLRDHYRSHTDIVGFSNHRWYQDSLRVWTDYSRLVAPPDGRYGVRWTHVAGRAQRPTGGSVIIQEEAETVVQQVIDLLLERRFAGTVGVVTPFRAQANKIEEQISQRMPADTVNLAQLTVDTVHGFQGDERDIILFSPCVSSDLPSGARGFLENTENLFNVALTRARSVLHVVGNRDACAQSSIPHVTEFADYCAHVERTGASPYDTTLAGDEHIGPWERLLYDALVAKGLNPIPQHAVNQYRLDLAVIAGNDRIAIEVDGESTHADSRLDAERDARLESLGWRVLRFWNHQIRDDLDYCVQRVLDILGSAAR